MKLIRKAGMKLSKAVENLARPAKGEQDELDPHLDLAMDIEGQIIREELRKLMELVIKTESGLVIVEIGSFRGRSATALGLAVKLGNKNSVYAVDPYVEFEGVFGGKFGPQDRSELYRNLFRAGVGDAVGVISLPSTAAAKSWSERNIGLLWIDGDHRYEAVRADLDAWHPFVVQGGTIAFHDTHTEGVQRAIEESVKAGMLRFVGKLNHLSWFEKP